MNRFFALVVGAVGLAIGGCASEPMINRELCANVVVDRDDVVIDDGVLVSAVGRADVVYVRFVGSSVPDTNGDGVVHVRASNVAVHFEGTLRGADSGVLPDAFQGTGVRVEGARNVRLTGLRATGFRVGLRATDADGLLVDDCSFENLWRMRLKSTTEKEHNDDWLWPHENDRQEWVTRYGAAVCIEKSGGVKVSRVKVRNGQNGIVLDRVEQGMLYDNDCSFLSGWGIAMWRSSGNLISRNALDFCVRGYSHGKYNRGQDSAGLLMFEQCNSNIVVENSMTHCGDGVFVFAGKEALGEKKVEGFVHRRKGCNDNVFVRNDCSFAPAHGLEVTFSFGNQIEENVFEGNAICGIWGGYSQTSLIRRNRFVQNGTKGAGEGGGINIEHGYLNTIGANEFSGNTVAVKLWDDDDGALLKTPWALVNHLGCRENMVVDNTVTQAEGAAFVVRKGVQTQLTGNRMEPVTLKEVDADAASTFVGDPPGVCSVEPPAKAVAVGDSRPVGARDKWRGREWIRMGGWGPVEPQPNGMTVTEHGEKALPAK